MSGVGTVSLQVRSIGKRECSNLFKLGDELIQFGELHQLLAASVADMLPVNASVLLSDDAKQLARSTGSLARQSSTADGSSYEAANAEMSGLPATKSFEGLMNSPWKVIPQNPECLFPKGQILSWKMSNWLWLCCLPTGPLSVFASIAGWQSPMASHV